MVPSMFFTFIWLMLAVLEERGNWSGVSPVLDLVILPLIVLSFRCQFLTKSKGARLYISLSDVQVTKEYASSSKTLCS